ncbi:D-cysteine desulfhydrase family protein [Sphingobacterium bovistauri]|uniref:D-cysteine desulfhydrase family protein n=1 Tax=Sphingobacterium bovistauri TaxID=2781959 RepID=A0ABS7Z8T2_9SPHI|nr:D-cysteine desulfhydrase family protein [Sphingobacterium bovistauri]MCA5006408.1 D-cysteine desulfhydrase family protein [Sphingobacterium bovistauri]
MTRISLKKHPKLKLIEYPSAIYFLRNISNLLGVDLYIKRDDLFSLGFGGNKLRKLEYLLGEAQKKNATHIFTIGALQSNHARMTAIASKMHGFEIELFLKKSVPVTEQAYFSNGNKILNNIIDATIHQVQDNNSAYQAIAERTILLEKEGARPYVIPVGGSNALGTLGYVDCYFEILQQANDLGIRFDLITSASGSGGTHGGLVVGNALSSSKTKIKAYNVEPDEGQLAGHTLKIANEALALCGEKPNLTLENIVLSNEYSGAAYGVPEEYHIDTIKFLAKNEGIFLDPVYTSKAFTGVIMDIQNNVIKKGEKVLYIHTGGIPGIFAYPQYF